MARRFNRFVRVAEMVGAAAAVAILAMLFLPRFSGGGEAASTGLEQPDQAGEPPAVWADLHREHGNVPLGRGQVRRDRG